MLKGAQHINLSSSITKPVCASTLFDTTLKVMGESQSSTPERQCNRLDISFAETIVGAEILLVEDNEINQQIAIELLEMAGLVVTVASNGKIAVETVEHKVFDAILMDIQMPVMDGYTATKEIRKDDKNASLPIIAMTANAMSGDKDKCLAAGMNEHLPKPINPQDVYKVLSQWIKPTGKVLNDLLVDQSKHEDIDLPNLPMFDVNAAVARMAGNVKAFRNTLKKVVDSENDAIDRIKEAINKKEYRTALIAAHTLKGVAATIGANFVVPSAEKIELLLNDKIEKGKAIEKEELEILLIECEVKLTQMIATINNDQQASKKAEQKPIFNVKAVDNLLLDLKDKIDNFDSAASETLEELLTYIDIEELSNDVTELVKALAAYNFDRVEELYTVLKQDINDYNYHGNKQVIDDESLFSKINVIGQQIENFDSTVVDSVDELLDFELDNEVYTALEKIRDVLSQYDFEAGIEQLDKIKASYFKKLKE
jgi:CheY-like chemotaxis protein